MTHTDDEPEHPAPPGGEGGDPRAGRLAIIGSRLGAWLAGVRERVPAVEHLIHLYERDKQAAGTLLGSALALRLFLFFVPLLLLVVGAVGLIGRFSTVDSVAGEAGITGSLATEIDGALDQQTLTPWLAIGIGLFGVATTGRSLTRALILSSALSWELGGRQRVRVRVIGVVVGVITGMSLISALVNRLSDAGGLAVASVSYLTLFGGFLVLWSTLFVVLPRGTTDPGAALPGAIVVALALTGLMAVTQLYVPRQIDSASAVYGAIGVTVTVLGWFFIVGRVLAFSFALNAVVFADFGSVSQVVFSLPLIRVLPRRLPALARFFDLDPIVRQRRSEATEPPD